MSFEQVRKVADAVLYEGYVLYPYRASSAKNQVRWQFGVVAPRAYSEASGADPWEMQTECLVEPACAVALDIQVRYLQTQARTLEQALDPKGEHFRPVETLELDGRHISTWEEGVEREVNLPVDTLPANLELPFEAEASREVDVLRGADGEIKGRIVRERWPVRGVVRVATESAGSLIKLRVRIENLSECDPECERNIAMRRSLLGAHTLLAVRGGAFVSLLDSPEPAAAAVASCVNLHTWPVLAGPQGQRELMLSSPIILYDYPAIAPESQGDFFDSTEIDEMLTLRVMTLTDEEKREACGTDERARQIIERSDTIPNEMLDKLHGAVRQFKPVRRDSSETDWVQIGPERVSKGSVVRLRPRRRADSMDLFLNGRTARVEGVFRDVEDRTYVAVLVEDDPAADLHRWYRRFLYFYPEEIELLQQEG